jgi:Protein of unknown function (DUF2905)
MRRLPFVFGLFLILLAVLWPMIAKLGLDRLPGDIAIERDNFHLCSPLATSLLISVVMSVLLAPIGR